MADPLVSPDAPASFTDYFNKQRGLKAEATALHAEDDDPKLAAGAVKLEQATGQDASYIYGNYDHFIKDQKADLVGGLLNNDELLKNYVLSHPLAASVSKDDWGPLSDYSQSMSDAQSLNQFIMPEGLKKPIANIFEGAARGWRAGWEGSEDIVSEEDIQKLPRPFQDLLRIAQNMPVHPLFAANLLKKVVFGALPTAIAEGSAETSRQFGYDETTSAHVARNIYDLATVLPMLMGIEIAPEVGAGIRAAQQAAKVGRQEILTGALGPKGYIGEPKVLGAGSKEIAELKDTVQSMLQRTGTFIKAGENVPLGADRIADLMHGADAVEAMKLLENMIKKGDKTATKPMSPELFQKLTEGGIRGNMAFNYDEVRALYGDKTPEPGDGILGDFSGVAEQFAKNDRTGKEIEIPLAELASKKVESETWQALKKGMRINEDRATINEAERFKTNEYQASRPMIPRPEIEGISPEDMAEEASRKREDVESAAGMEPYFRREAGMPPQRLQLAPSRGVPYPALKGEHSFVITDEIGRHMADLELTPSKDGRDIEVNWIGGHTPMHQTPERLRNMFSPGLMKDLLRQVQEQFPEAKTLSGTKIRDEGGRVSIDLAESQQESPRGWEHVEALRDIVESGEWVPFSQTTEALVSPRATWTSEKNAIFDKVQGVLDRLIPKYSRVQAAHDIRRMGRSPTGVYVPPQEEGLFATVLWSFDSPHPTGTARHEAIHFLRHQGFITKDEWKILTDASMKGDWIGKHNIAERYAGQPLATMLEESIAEEFRTWAEAKNKDQHPGNFFYKKLNNLILAVKDVINKHFGRTPTVNELFENIEAGRVGSRENREELPGTAQYWPKDAEMAELTPEEQSLALESAKAQAAATPKEEQKLPFGERALGPKATHEQYARNIAKWEQKKLDRKQRQLVKEELKRQAPQWKENYLSMQQEVTKNITNRPDFKVQRFFQYGELNGEKTNYNPKLDPKFIWPDLLEHIPKQFIAGKGEEGLDPAKIAGHFGYPDGYSLVADMAELGKARGPEGPKAFYNKLIKDEVNRRMKQEYGTPEDQALKAAREDATDPDLFNIMHQDSIKFLEQARAEGHTVDDPISKDDMKAAAWQEVLDTNMPKATLKESHRNLGRLFGELEGIHLGGTGDPVRAYKLSQRRAQEMAKAIVLKQIEKEKAAFERVMKAGYKRDPAGLPANYAAWLHHAMTRIGREIQRDPEDLATALSKDNQPYDTLQQFADDHNLQATSAPYDEIERPPKLPVYEKFNDPNWTTDIDKGTVREFREINDTVQAIMKLGRDSERITVGAERLLKDDVVRQLVGQMLKFPEYGRIQHKLGKKWEDRVQSARTIAGGLLQWRTRAERFDQFDPKGPWSKYINGPIDAAAANAAVIEKRHAREWTNSMAKVEGIKDFNPEREVPNDRIYDPNGWAWTDSAATGKKRPFVPEGTQKFKAMNEENLVMAIVRWLEPTSRDKLVRGFLSSEAETGAWIWQHSERIHWEIADKIGEVLERYAKEEDEVARRQNGKLTRRLPTPPVEGKFGTVKGRYYPASYDTSVAVPKEFEIHPTQGIYSINKDFTKERTNYAAPMDLTFTSINQAMKRRSDFIAWDETLNDLRKIIKDPEFAQNVRVQHGPHAYESLDNYITNIANRPGHTPGVSREIRGFFNWMIGRSIGNLVGFKASTIAKHVPSLAVMGAREAPKYYLEAAGDVTKLRVMQNLFQSDPRTMQMTRGFQDIGDPSIGYEGSTELKSRSRTLLDHYPEAVNYALNKVGKWEKFTDAWNQVSASIFRVNDNFFSRITQGSGMLEEYHKLIDRGYSHDDAVHLASEEGDRRVRISHGTLSAVTQAEYFRQLDPLTRNSAALFGFWGNRANRMFLTTAKIKDMAMLRRNKTFFRDFGDVVASHLVYGLGPMIIEDLVEPICNREESNMRCFLKWGAFSGMSFFPGGNTLAWAMLSGMNPDWGVIGSQYRSAKTLVQTAGHAIQNEPEKIDWGNTIKSGLQVASFALGPAGGLQAGSIADYVWKLTHDEEKAPEGVGEAARLAFSGKVKEKRHVKENIWQRMFMER